MRSLLSGQDDTACRDVVLLNAAAAMATETGDFNLALADARTSLESGAALSKLDGLIAISQKFAQAVA
jgi:anthranilate phosphoribosyltransferase